MLEIWKTITDFVEYEISNYGRVRTKRKSPKSFKKHDEFGYYYLKFGKRNKYNSVQLYNDSGCYNFSVHRLVCFAFNGAPVPPKNIVDHIDRNPTNNRADNLRWVTYKENTANSNLLSASTLGSMRKKATLRVEDLNPGTSISREMATKIVQKLLLGYSCPKISKELNIGEYIIKDIRTKRTWKSLTQNIKFPKPKIRASHNYRTKLSAADVVSIRHSSLSHKALASSFNCSIWTVRRIKKGITRVVV